MNKEGKVKQCWLDVSTGEFSDSWDKEDFTIEIIQKALKHIEDSDQWKLIEYTCVTDTSFSLNGEMRLR